MAFEYWLYGRVIPERVSATISPLHYHFMHAEAGIDCDVFISVQLSQIAIRVRSQNPITDFGTLKNYLSGVVQTELDCFNFLRGYAYVAEIESLTSADPEQHVVFGVQIPEIESKAGERPFDFETLVRTLMNPGIAPIDQQQLRLALENFRLAIKNPGDTAMYCYRALECLQKAFGTDWNAMNGSLNVDKTWSDKMREDHAQQQRHGKSTFMNGADRAEMLLRTQQVIDRFVLYVRRGKSRLDLNTYPILKG